jgi:hypothetical protein
LVKDIAHLCKDRGSNPVCPFGSFTIQNYKIREKEEFCVLQEMRTKLKSRKGDHRPKHAFDLQKNNPHGQKFIAYI